MVTFWPPEVVSVKPDADTLLAVPIEPPAAGPDRALDPWAPEPKSGLEGLLLAATELLLLDRCVQTLRELSACFLFSSTEVPGRSGITAGNRFGDRG